MGHSFKNIVRAVLAQQMPSGSWVTYGELMSHFRARPITEARILVCVLCRLHLHDPSYPKIGRLLNRDHTSIQRSVAVFHARQQHFRAVFAKAETLLLELAQAPAQWNDSYHFPQGVPFQ